MTGLIRRLEGVLGLNLSGERVSVAEARVGVEPTDASARLATPWQTSKSTRASPTHEDAAAPRPIGEVTTVAEFFARLEAPKEGTE